MPSALPAARPQAAPATVLTVASIAGFAVLTVAVVTGVLRPLDADAREWARPGGVWGPAQLRADLLVETLRPDRVVWLPVVVGVLQGVARRSVRPLLLVGLTVGLVSGLVVGLKEILATPDAHGDLTHGGSFPSGHTVSVLVASGLSVLLIRAHPPRWVWVIPAALVVGMGGSLMVEGAHWGSDVVGGALLGAALLCGLRASGLVCWATRPGAATPGA
ncbi:MAG TPA: phosphatase PAP2 family protein [Kineosporiaceae bacterium]